ncbi:hypothetical protein QFZ66_004629 [Streptomyces sp. B4I13]|uniref:hypothetical protein n=1 Tax=Streptomyces sp. B4I13 TaxID=3042271 RepID=UPI0027872C36|nr:hypothetical protein [Streptomyces sp. B4I13]MDQ0960751.1 hypothetical protein [Streptomyces sp. B4I13]
MVTAIPRASTGNIAASEGQRLPAALQGRAALVNAALTAWIYDIALARQRDRYTTIGNWGSIGVAILTAITGTAIWANLSGDPSTGARVIVLCVVFISAALSAMASLMARNGREYARIQQDWRALSIELQITLDTLIKGKRHGYTALVNRSKNISQLPVPQHLWNKVKGEVEEKMRSCGYYEAP